MSLKEKLKRWTFALAEEGAAETVTEIAIDQLLPVRILALLTYGGLLMSLMCGVAGWYFHTYETLWFILSGITGFVAAVLYLVRMYVVSKSSALLLKSYRHVKERARAKPVVPKSMEIRPPAPDKQTQDKSSTVSGQTIKHRGG